jgi:Ca2+-binding RTX toxin-like protein
MVNPIAWIQSDKALTYAEAEALAASLGGRLLVVPDDSGPMTSLRDVLNHEEDPVWVNGGPHPGHLPDDRIPHILVEFVGPTANPDPFFTLLAPAPVRGTAGNDQFLGGPGAGYSLRAGAGDDLYIGGGGGGTIDLGSGNDTLFFGEVEAPPWGQISDDVGPTLIYDGDGADCIEAPSFSGSTVLRAAIDGDNDTFLLLTRLSYGSDVAGIRAVVSGQESTGTASGVGIGTDSVRGIHEIVGGSGNDHIEGFARIQGGAGNDYLAPTSYAEGGAFPRC